MRRGTLPAEPRLAHRAGDLSPIACISAGSAEGSPDLDGPRRDVMRGDDLGDSVGDFRRGLIRVTGPAASHVNVAVDLDHQRDAALWQVPADGRVTGDAAVVADPAVEVEQPDPVALARRASDRRGWRPFHPQPRWRWAY